jgi:hypothetical protein
MGVDHSIMLAIQRSKFKEGLKQLCQSPSNVDITDWQVVSDLPYSTSHPDFISWIVSKEHLKKQDKNFTGGLKISFLNTKYQKCVEIWLRYRGAAQFIFDDSLDLALVTLYAGGGTHGISNLFSPKGLPAFLHIIKALPVVFGHNVSDVGFDAEWETPEQSKAIHLPDWRHLLLIGTPLIPSFGIDRLRQTKTFATWELEGLFGFTFIYANTVYLYDAYGAILFDPAVEEIGFSEISLDSVDDIDLAQEKSDHIIKKELGLPKTISI